MLVKCYIMEYGLDAMNLSLMCRTTIMAKAQICWAVLECYPVNMAEL